MFLIFVRVPTLRISTCFIPKRAVRATQGDEPKTYSFRPSYPTVTVQKILGTFSAPDLRRDLIFYPNHDVMTSKSFVCATRLSFDALVSFSPTKKSILVKLLVK